MRPTDARALRLVEPEAEHAGAWQEMREQPSTRRWNPVEGLVTDDVADRLSRYLTDLSSGQEGDYRWMVVAGREVVGTVGLRAADFRMGTAQIGYIVAEAHQGRGLGTRSVSVLLDRVFAASGLARVVAFVHPDNVASVRLLERLGFRREGRLRKHMVIDGARVDQLVYGLLAEEWRASRPGSARG